VLKPPPPRPAGSSQVAPSGEVKTDKTKHRQGWFREGPLLQRGDPSCREGTPPTEWGSLLQSGDPSYREGTPPAESGPLLLKGAL